MKRILGTVAITMGLLFGTAHAGPLGEGATSTLQAITTVTATTTAALAVPYNMGRKSLLVINRGSVSVIVTPNAAGAGSEGVTIPAGGNWEPFVVPLNALYVKSASSTATVDFIYGL